MSTIPATPAGLHRHGVTDHSAQAIPVPGEADRPVRVGFNPDSACVVMCIDTRYAHQLAQLIAQAPGGGIDIDDIDLWMRTVGALLAAATQADDVANQPIGFHLVGGAR